MLYYAVAPFSGHKNKPVLLPAPVPWKTDKNFNGACIWNQRDARLSGSHIKSLPFKPRVVLDPQNSMGVDLSSYSGVLNPFNVDPRWNQTFGHPLPFYPRENLGEWNLVFVNQQFVPGSWNAGRDNLWINTALPSSLSFCSLEKNLWHSNTGILPLPQKQLQHFGRAIRGHLACFSKDGLHVEEQCPDERKTRRSYKDASSSRMAMSETYEDSQETYGESLDRHLQPQHFYQEEEQCPDESKLNLLQRY